MYNLGNSLIIGCAFLALTTQAKDLTGIVVGVHDGDTFTLLTEDKVIYKIRLRHIDTPELKQPYSQFAKQSLSDLVYKKMVSGSCPSKSWNRYVCDVVAGGLDVQYEMVKTGAAWVYPKYNRRDDLPHLQMQARKKRIGIWQQPFSKITPPWRYRKSKKK